MVAWMLMNFELDTYTPKVERAEAPTANAPPKGDAVSALEILLDGVEARLIRKR